MIYPSEEAHRKTELSRQEAESLIERELRCPECGYKAGTVFSDCRGHMLDSPVIEKEPLKNRIFEYASLLYETFDAVGHMTERIRAALQRTGPLSCYNGELTAGIASAITLHAGKTVSLTLKNGQQIRKEKIDGNSITETGAHHRPDHTAGECAQRTKHDQAGSRLLPGIHQAGRTAQQL